MIVWLTRSYHIDAMPSRAHIHALLISWLLTLDVLARNNPLPFRPRRVLNHAELLIEHNVPLDSFPESYSPSFPVMSRYDYSVLLNSSTGTFATLSDTTTPNQPLAPPDFSATINVSLSILCTDRHEVTQDLFVNITAAHYVTNSTTDSGTTSGMTPLQIYRDSLCTLCEP